MDRLGRAGMTLRPWSGRQILMFVVAVLALGAFAVGLIHTVLDIGRTYPLFHIREDRLDHGLTLFALTLSLALALKRRPIALLTLAMIALGGAVEIFQALPFVGGDAELVDWFADVAGVLCAAGPLFYFSKQIPNTRPRILGPQTIRRITQFATATTALICLYGAWGVLDAGRRSPIHAAWQYSEQACFAFLTVLVVLALRPAYPTARVALALLLAGGAIEGMQHLHWVTGRGDLVDWAAEAVGILLGATAVATARLRRDMAEPSARTPTRAL